MHGLQQFRLPVSANLGHISCDSNDNKPTNLLFLHGAGSTTDRSSFDPIRTALLTRGITSCAFDFIGHGETKGNIETTCLADRTRQSLSLINSGKLQKPVSLIATSMSGYTAIKLLPLCRITKLVLIVPAVYDQAVYNTPFGKKFRSAIRKNKSWLNSDAWKILAGFQGDLLVIVAGNDTVVPEEITDKIFKSAIHTQHKDLYVVKNSSHKILSHLNKHKEEFDQVIELIHAFLKTNPPHNHHRERRIKK